MTGAWVLSLLVVPAGLGRLTLAGLADPSPCVPGVFSALHFCLGNWCPRRVIQGGMWDEMLKNKKLSVDR